MRSLIYLIFLCFVPVASAVDSFVGKGKILELTIAPSNVIIIHLDDDKGCKKERYHLKLNGTDTDIYVKVLTQAMENQWIVSLHNSSGSKCTTQKVFFDVVNVQSY